MTKLFALLILGSIALNAAEPIQTHHKRWLYGAMTLLAANSVDAASSYGYAEANPALGRTFNAQSVGIKFGIVGGCLGAQWLIMKQYPKLERMFTPINYAQSGVLTGIAVRNWRVR